MTHLTEKVKEKEKLNMMHTVFAMMFNPSKAIKDAVHGSRWYYGMGVSALAFGLFFVQTGLDLWKTGQKSLSFVFFSLFSGVGYGLIMIPLVSLVAWAFLKAFKVNKEMKWTIASFCLSYSGALVYGLLGLSFSILFQWKTAIAFGVSGVLWAIGPMMVTVREMTDGKVSLSVPVATVYAALVLLSWAYFGQL